MTTAFWWGLSVYAAVGFGATIEWLLYRNAVSRETPIKWLPVIYMFIAWPIGLFSLVAMLCSRRVKANVRKNLGVDR